ncbi:hypothetical protein J7J18_07045 [bacterium]|nr:hypothetical protein [bacterium]
MIEAYLQSAKTFEFRVTIEGVHYSVLTAYLRVQVGKIELGFPGEVLRDKIVVTIPALQKFVSLALDRTYKVRLEVIGGGFYLVPWEDSIVFKPSIAVKNVEVVNEKTPCIVLKRRSV